MHFQKGSEKRPLRMPYLTNAQVKFGSWKDTQAPESRGSGRGDRIVTDQLDMDTGESDPGRLWWAHTGGRERKGDEGKIPGASRPGKSFYFSQK